MEITLGNVHGLVLYHWKVIGLSGEIPKSSVTDITSLFPPSGNGGHNM